VCLCVHVCVRVCVRVCVCVCVSLIGVIFSSNVVTRAGHLGGVQSKCHRDQCRAVGVASQIGLRGSIDVERSKWILTAVTPSIINKTH